MSAGAIPLEGTTPVTSASSGDTVGYRMDEPPPLPAVDPALTMTEFHVAPPLDHPHAEGPRLAALELMSPAELAASPAVFSADYAELSFNLRVLQMALDKDTPLLERFKFLCIVASNLDEVFAKRLGNLPAPTDDEKSTTVSNHQYKLSIRPRSEYETRLAKAVRALVGAQYRAMLDDILPALDRDAMIRIVAYNELTDAQRSDLRKYFKKNLAPLITPLMADQTHPFPTLHSHVLYLQIEVLNPESLIKRSVYVRIPSEDRLLPVGTDRLKYVLLEDIIAQNITLVCDGVEFIKAYPFRVTRNVKLELNDTKFGESDNLVDFVWEETHRRRTAPATRLEVSHRMPKTDKDKIIRELMLDPDDVFVIPSNYIGLSDFIGLASSPVQKLQYPAHTPSVPKRFAKLEQLLNDDPGRIFDEVRKNDVLIDYPKHSFAATALLFLRAAGRDPNVVSIKCVIYRGGGDSPLVAALKRAAKYGKEVSVMVELKASFDEVRNSNYASELREAGCNVSHGLMGLKTHSKVMLVVRREESGLRYYCNIATGNFNAKTAALYTDLALFTCREDICKDVSDVFHALFGYSRKRNYQRLLVAPVTMLDAFLDLIRTEAANARRGEPAEIIVQINGLSCPYITQALYEASSAGVRIALIVRGLCSVRPGIPGRSENIRVLSWVGQFLQHRRIFYFCTGGLGAYYIGSADWRTRNLTERVEVVTPIDCKSITKKLHKALQYFLNDKKNTWEMGCDGRYYKRKHVSDNEADVFRAGSSSSSPPLRQQHSQGDGTSIGWEGDPHDEVYEEVSKEWEKARIARRTGSDAGSAVGENGAQLMPSLSTLAKGRLEEVDGYGDRPGTSKSLSGCIPFRTKDGVLEILLITEAMSGTIGAHSPVTDEANEAKKQHAHKATWTVPKGNVMTGEDILEAAKREVEEEAGVTGLVRDRLGWFIAGRKRDKLLHLFVFEVERHMEWAEEYLRDRCWFTVDEALALVEGAESKSPTYVAPGVRKASAWVEERLKQAAGEEQDPAATNT